MAGQATIGALRVVIGADTAALDKGLQESQARLQQFGNSMKLAGAVIAGALAAAIGGIAVGIKKTISEADNMGNVAAKIGMTTESLSALKYAAEFSDVSFETLTTSMGKLNKSMVAVAGGAGGPAAKAFQALGISVTDSNGSLKTNEQVLKEVATKFAGYEDGAAKSALAMAIFGKSGAEMIPLLNEGGAGIDALTQRARDLGVVISGETSDAADKLGKTMFDLGAVKSATFLKITEQLLPTLQNLANVFVGAANNSNLMKAAGQVLMVVFNTLATAVINIGASLTAFSAILSSVIAAAINVAKGEFSAAWNDLKKGAGDSVEAFKSAGNSLIQIWTGTGAVVAETTTGIVNNVKKTAAPIIQMGDNGAKAAEKLEAAANRVFISSAKTKAGLDAELATVGMNVGAQAQYKFVLEQTAIAKEKGYDQIPGFIEKLKAEGAAIGEMTNKVNTATQAYQFIDGQLDKTAGALTDVAMGTKEPAEAFRELALSVVRDIGVMIAKALLMKVIFGSLGLGMPGGGAGAGGNLASSFLGFASGGSFQVPGGISSNDNTVVPLHLAAGERVTVDSNHNTADSNVVQINFGARRTKYDRMEVMELIEGINEAIGDGARIKIA